jgi:succinyl-CoA synthetase beta subunit
LGRRSDGEKNTQPANFLDGGGGANRRNARAGILTLAGDPDVRAIFVNIFGGITRTDLVAEGLIDAMKENERLKSGEVPVVARMRGTNQDAAAKLVSGKCTPPRGNKDRLTCVGCLAQCSSKSQGEWPTEWMSETRVLTDVVGRLKIQTNRK